MGLYNSFNNSSIMLILNGINWYRGKDSNLRPSGYEPDELPDCSTPRSLHPAEIAGYSSYLGINP